MVTFFEISNTIVLFERETGLKRREMLMVMGPLLRDQLKNDSARLENTILGVPLVVRDEIDDLSYGLYSIDCKDHIEEHLAELGYLEVIEEEGGFFNCDLCDHPVTFQLVDEDFMAVCPWCGDKNELEEIELEQ